LADLRRSAHRDFRTEQSGTGILPVDGAPRRQSNYPSHRPDLKCVRGNLLPAYSSTEYDRLLAVMDVRLRDREFLAGDYSIADIAAFPWVMPYRRLGNDLHRFKNLRNWFDTIKQRPAVQRGVDLGKNWHRDPGVSEAARSVMFEQDSETVFRAAGENK
jgi:hypothetical protein